MNQLITNDIVMYSYNLTVIRHDTRYVEKKFNVITIDTMSLMALFLARIQIDQS